jgi:hypothetical protein
MDLSALSLRSVERVEHPHASSRDVGRVAGDEGHIPDLGRGRHGFVEVRSSTTMAARP